MFLSGSGNKRLGRCFMVIVSLILCLCILCGNSSLTDALAANKEPYVDSPDYRSLKEAFSDYFEVGVAMPQTGSWYVGNTKRGETVKKTFSSMTTENEFKPDTNFDPSSPTLYKAASQADRMLKYCDDNGILMRYHVLVWHSQINASIFGKDFKATSGGTVTRSANSNLDEECLVDRDTLLDRLKTYIYGAFEYIYSSGYADTVYAVDVVNEAVEESKPDGLRQSYWYKIIGPEFLYYAFLFAREAEYKYRTEYADLYGLDPAGDLSSITPALIYNDYNEWFPARVNIITEFTTQTVWNEDQSMVKSSAIAADGDGTMKGDGLIDGIGMQGHLLDTQNIDQYISALKKYSEAVGQVQITELDVGCTHTGENKWYYQAQFYYDFFSALIKACDEGADLTSVTLWGLSDDASWRRDSSPLLFDANLGKKSAYDAVLLAADKEEFTLTLASTITDMNDIEIDFEPYKDGGTTTFYTPEKAGFMARGTGHQPRLEMAPRVNHTPDTVIGYSMIVTRQEQDATVMMDVSKFSGKNVTFTAYVKTDDPEIRVGLETGESIPLVTAANKEEWNPVSLNFDIPEGLTSAFIYFETDGSADMYIDDVSVIYTKEGQEPAPVVASAVPEDDGSSEDKAGNKDAAGMDTGADEAGSKAASDAGKTGNEQGSDESAVSTQMPDITSAGAGKNDQSKAPTKGAVAVAIVAAAAGATVYFLRKKKKDE